MNYLYHIVPKNMQGAVLYPLNVLKNKSPDLYKIEAEKYKGREQIMEQIIPGLNCLWNDVLHFTAVHPRDVKQGLIDAGQLETPKITCYQIDPAILEPDNAIVYLYASQKRGEQMKEDNFTRFVPEELSSYALLSQETKDYYKECIDKGERPLLFHRVPHVLYKGSIDVSKTIRITV